MTTEPKKCCGAFPDYVCASCPHANAEQTAAGGTATTARCMQCFLPWAAHTVPGMKCPEPVKVTPPPPPPPAPATPPPAPKPPRVQNCPSCSKPWTGQRQARGVEGMWCGTCGQPAQYA
jgi:hypothetical protein